MARPVEKRRYGQQLPGASRLRGIRPTRGGDPAGACRARGDSRPVREDAARHSSPPPARGGRPPPGAPAGGGGVGGALGPRLYGLERQIDPGPEEIERRLAATESEPSSPGRAQRLAVLERRRDAVRALARRRDALAATLTTTLTALASLRAAIEQEPERLDDALRVATGCLESAQPT